VQGEELTTALTSPTVTSPVFTSALTLEKDASARTFTLGDRVTYTISVHNGSPTASLRDLDVTDALPAGLQYLPGTSRVGGAPVADPIRTAAGLTWRLPTLEARSTVKVTFDARVLPGAGQNLVNVAAAQALGVNGVVIAANEDRVAVRVTAAPFAPPQDLIGRVFLDHDRDDRYDEGTDTPVARARLLLPNGRTVLTDERGRYHFASVGVDRVAVRLDPASVRWTPRAAPGDPDASGTRLVSVRGLTSADFALEPYDGAATALRDTRLSAGPLTLIKTVTREPEAGTYRVRLTLRATETLRGLTLLDPLPVGAVLMDGANTLAPQDFTGERTWTYTFHFSGAPEHTTTDPTITWNTRTGGRP
jgi:uncharacterized repeat protein (TIGR01451 family)